MKAAWFCSLCYSLFFTACSSTYNSYIDSNMENEPKIGEHGTFNSYGFSTSTCINNNKNIHIIMDSQIISMVPKKLLNAQITGDSDEQRKVNMQALLASENINSLGCKENPFPANDIWITSELKRTTPILWKHFYNIKVMNQYTKEKFAFIEKSIISANQLPNCTVNNDVKICRVVEPVYGNSNEEVEVIYRTWINNSSTLQTGAPITERCTFIINDDESFSEIKRIDTCIVHDILPSGFMFYVYYFNNTPSDHLGAINVFKAYSKQAVKLTAR
ncbi:MAG: hypothetical protein HRU38_02220 [Saccharospirillaceae bacterium]|nr:hypothetical protein [Pseudomonadales bacterium]NRB77475.1 hypothetical protein [Saccharospirillaceae bacterium]